MDYMGNAMPRQPAAPGNGLLLNGVKHGKKDRASGFGPQDKVAAAWAKRSGELASWAMKYLVNRTDAFGHYYAFAAREAKGQTAFTDKSSLTLDTLVAHFAGHRQDNIVGLHSTSKPEIGNDGKSAICSSKWLAIDIDRHEDGVDEEANLNAAQAWFELARELGFNPLLEDSNGRGGYHLIILFDKPIPTELAYTFGQWLTRDWQILGLRSRPETFPKQSKIRLDGFGNWLRLPGRHHTHDHFSRIWDGRTWLQGEDAIEAILATTGGSPDRIPIEARRIENPKATARKGPEPDPTSDADRARDALRFLADKRDSYSEWLEVGMCLTSLGNEGLNIWIDWSSGSDKFEPGACEKKWASFKRDSGRGLGSIFYWAKERGWQERPRTCSSRPSGRPTRSPRMSDAPPETIEHEVIITKAQRDDDASNETEDDPHRLARLILKDRFSHADGPTLVGYQGECLRWSTAYQAMPDKDLEAAVTQFVKAEFDRLNRLAVEKWQNAGGVDEEGKRCPPPTTRKVVVNLVKNVMGAIRGETTIDAGTQQPSWLRGVQGFPADEVLPTRNALVHLPSLVAGRDAIHPPTPRFFCPYALDYDFDLQAPMPSEWLNFLESIWPDDSESIATLQEWFGHLLTPDTSYQKILMLIGPKRSGKGTIVRVLGGLVGQDNVVSPTLSGLSGNFGKAPLIGKPAAVITDARLSGRSDIAQVVEGLLSISGEDSQTIDRKHRSPWTGKLPTRFTIVSNEIPRVPDASGALAGRMLILRMTRSFYGKEDRRLTQRLMGELPGILLWAIEGWRRLRERGHFLQPESGVELARELEDLSSPIGAFLKDCCKVAPGNSVRADHLFTAWKQWCVENGRDHHGDLQKFGRDLRSALPSLDSSSKHMPEGGRKRCYVGLGLICSTSY